MGLGCLVSIVRDIIFVLRLMRFLEREGWAMYCTIGPYVESTNGLPPFHQILHGEGGGDR